MIRSCFKLSVVVIWSLMALLATQAYGQRQMENLGRGVVAVNQGGGKVFVSWRLLGTDPDSIRFHLVRGEMFIAQRTETFRRGSEGRNST